MNQKNDLENENNVKMQKKIYTKQNDKVNENKNNRPSKKSQ